MKEDRIHVLCNGSQEGILTTVLPGKSQGVIALTCYLTLKLFHTVLIDSKKKQNEAFKNRCISKELIYLSQIFNQLFTLENISIIFMQLKTSLTAEGPSSIPSQGTTKIPQAMGVTKKNLAQMSLSYAKFTAFLENMIIKHYLRQLFVFFLSLLCSKHISVIRHALKILSSKNQKYI